MSKKSGKKMSILLMAKDVPVLKVQDGKCEILHEELLPFSIRKNKVLLEDFYGNWISPRALQLSRTNSKMILNAARVSQSNAFAICRACYGLSFSDMYWFKDAESDVSWKDINLFDNDISKGMASTALVGDVFRETGKIHTPEFTTQGVTAKAWVKRADNTYLYKIARKEIAASRILDVLGFDHVTYEEVTGEEFDEVVTPERKAQIDALGEKVVKCGLISSKDVSMVNFEDYQLYCEKHGKNVFLETINMDKRHYLEMQVADYILNNVDRHTANWGYFMDNSTGELTGLYPLLDHDHAFSDVEGMMSQTTEERMDLLSAAMIAQSELMCDITAVLSMERPEGLTENEWQGVLRRTDTLQKCSRIYLSIMDAGYEPDWELIEQIQKIEKFYETEMTLTDIIEKYNAGVECCEGELALIGKLKHLVSGLQ